LSFSVDVNLLLYASDTSSPLHRAAADFLAERLAAPENLYLAWPTAMAYLRIATHPAIFASPLSPREALENLQSLLALPRVRAIAEREGFLEEYARVTRGMAARGNLVPDAHLATLLWQHGIRTLYTHDTDFKKFDFLDARFPLAP
jgi:uncharacterized protein